MDAIARTVEGEMMDWLSFGFGFFVGMTIMDLVFIFILSR